MAKRKRADAHTEEITFDPSARQDYLTGFHKRKVARIQYAKDTAVKMEKEERRKQRQNIRVQRKEDLEKHVQEMAAELKKQQRVLEEETDGEDEGWQGLDGDDVQDEKIEEVEEDFVDEDKYTTVTVEAMGDSEPEDKPTEARSNGIVGKKVNGDVSDTKKPESKARHAADRMPKPKKRKFRYESKAERSATRQHQRAKGQKARARREDNDKDKPKSKGKSKGK